MDGEPIESNSVTVENNPKRRGYSKRLEARLVVDFFQVAPAILAEDPERPD